MTTSCTRWAHIYIALALRFPVFAERHNMVLNTKKGIVFRTAVPIYGGHLFRQMFAVLPDGRIFGPRNRQVDEKMLIAWLNDENGMDDIL